MGGCALFGHKNVLNLIQSGCTQGGLIVQYKIVKQFPAVQLAHHWDKYLRWTGTNRQM